MSSRDLAKGSIFPKMDTNRMELLGLFARTLFFGAFAVYSVKYMSNLLDPSSRERKDAQKRAKLVCSKINLPIKQLDLNEHELVIASQLIDPNSIETTWSDIGGLDVTIEGLRKQVILPLKMHQVENIELEFTCPMGVLLHGPPGCGKTMLAKATAKAANARFIDLEVAMLTDKWYGESQKLTKAVFTLAQKIAPCIIFIDEIDSFLRSRNSQDHEATAMVKAQFLTLWDGLKTAKKNQVVIIGATNRPCDVDRAILRRMPASYAIELPNAEKRKAILMAMSNLEHLEPGFDMNHIAQLTKGFSGSDLKEVHRSASMIRAIEFAESHPEIFDIDLVPSCSTSTISSTFSMLNGNSNDTNPLRYITMKDFTTVIEDMKVSRSKISAVETFIDLD